MAFLLMYSLKSAFVLSLLYVPYVLVLRCESFFRFNRVVLLSILLLSLLLPLCNIPWLSLDNQPVVHAAQMQLIELGVPINGVLPEVDVVAATHTARTGISLFAVVSLIYIIGMGCVLAVRLWQVESLARGMRRGALWSEEKDGVRVYCRAGEVSPFSWMRSVVISEHDYEENGSEILLHERGHIRARHSWDVLLLTLVEMLQWWNPFVYMLGISLRDVHEYEADDFVLRQGISAQGYQLLVVKKAVGSGSYAFANSFNHSLTKKRITMMCRKSKSNAWMRCKALYVIPVAALALSVFATPKIVAPVEGAVNNLAGKGTESSPDLQASKEFFASAPQDTAIYDTPEVKAEYPGGSEAFFKFLQENIRYPHICQQAGIQGRVMVNFIVEKDGRITEITPFRFPSQTLSEEMVAAFKKEFPQEAEGIKAGQDAGKMLCDEAVRVLKLMPNWKPARDGKDNPVRCRFVVPVMFRLQ